MTLITLAMKQIGEIANVHQQQNLPQLSANISKYKLDADSYSMSVYNDQLTTNGVVKTIARLKSAFPNLLPGFYDVLLERIKEKGFTDTRFMDAVNNLIDNYHFPTPTVAEIITWDRRINMFNYDQMVKKMDESGLGKRFWQDYKSVMLPDLPARVWIHINDIKKYHINEVTTN